MATDARILRMEEVLAQRIGHVRCAVEAVYHRHNVSAILRTCDSVGLHHVHLVGERFTATRGASRGAERWLALHRHETAEEAVAEIKAAGFRLWVADLADPATPPAAVPVDEPICVWVGAELEGVSTVARAAADGVVTVPMRGFAQSLNVGVAAALALSPIAERARALGARARVPAEERERILADWIAREDPLRAGIEARARMALD